MLKSTCLFALIVVFFSIKAQDTITRDDYSFRALTLQDSGKYEESLKWFIKALDIDSNHVLSINGAGVSCYRLGDTIISLQYYDRAIAVDTHNYLPFSNRGNIYCDLKRFDESLADYNYVLQLLPGHPLTLANRCRLFLSLNKLDTAIEDCTKSIDSIPMASTYNTRANIWWEKKEYTKASNDFNTSFRLDTTYFPSYYSYGAMLLSFDQFNRAIPYFEKAIRNGMKYDDCYLLLGFCYLNIGDNENALIYLTKTIELNPYNASAYFNRGTLYAFSGKLDLALEDLNKAVVPGETMKNALINRALLVYGETGEYREAIKDLEIVLNSANDSTSIAYALNNIGYMQYKMENYSSAMNYILRSLEYFSENSYAYRNLAKVYHVQGDKFKTCEAIDKSILLGFTKSYGNEIIEMRDAYCK